MKWCGGAKVRKRRYELKFYIVAEVHLHMQSHSLCELERRCTTLYLLYMCTFTTQVLHQRGREVVW